MDLVKSFNVLGLLITVLLCSVNCGQPKSTIKQLNEDNWQQILENEWLVEFYAPWCPACTALQPIFAEVSVEAWSRHKVYTGAVDVTVSPGLSGRFVVTALPTIYHVKDGEFRQYKGPRDVGSITAWLGDQRWKSVEPLSSWKAPNSYQMTAVAYFFRLSQGLRSIHTDLMETYGLPTWGSYLIFALATIIMGAVLGLLLVCLIDLLYPPKKNVRGRAHVEFVPSKKDGADAEELIKEDLIDEDEEDSSKNDDSDAEKNSQSDTQSQSSDNEQSDSAKKDSEADKQKEKSSGDGGVRKRKNKRRAD